MSDSDLQSWVGRQEVLTDQIHATSSRALAATLNQTDTPLRPGDPLPGLWHWLYFLPLAPTSGLGPDGHPRRGGFLPPVPLERRMWAGGRLGFHDTLRIDDEVERTSTIQKLAEKEGKAGRMAFVTVRHEIRTTRGLAIEEEQDIVYLAMPKVWTAPDPVPLPTPLDWVEPYPIDRVLLFRFSALTFNAHRIHYDLSYTTGQEHYPGLVVHGPLQAILLFASATMHVPGRRPAGFSFRGVRPLFDFDRVSIAGRSRDDGGHDLFSANADGHVAMQATMSWHG